MKGRWQVGVQVLRCPVFRMTERVSVREVIVLVVFSLLSVFLCQDLSVDAVPLALSSTCNPKNDLCYRDGDVRTDLAAFHDLEEPEVLLLQSDVACTRCMTAESSVQDGFATVLGDGIARWIGWLESAILCAFSSQSCLGNLSSVISVASTWSSALETTGVVGQALHVAADGICSGLRYRLDLACGPVSTCKA